jgi:hypothetical protein
VDLRTLQRPIKERYRAEPEAARITLRAQGSQSDVPISCSVDLGHASLAEKTERYCTVLRTLTDPPPIQADWRTK